MPIYEYQCDGCGEVFEVRQKMSDAPPTGHTCGAKSVRRILSNTSFVLKGTGWYKTDYAEKKPQAKADGEGGAGKAAAEKSSDASSNASPAGEKKSSASGEKAPSPPSGGSDTSSKLKASGKGDQAA